MAQDPAQIRAQIEAVRARLEDDLDEVGPVVSRRLHRARRLAQVGAIAGVALVVVLLLPARRQKRRARRREGCCSKRRAAFRRR